MKVVIHLPNDEIKLNGLKKLISDVHSYKVINYISNSGLSHIDKEKLIDLIVQNEI